MQVSLQQFSYHLVKLHRLTAKTMWRSLTFHQSWSELSNTLTLHPALPKTRLHSDSDSVNTRRRKLKNLTASHWYRAVYRFVIGKDSEKSFDVASVLLLKKKACFYDQMWLLIVKFCTNSHKSKRVHLEFDMGGKFKSLTVLTTTTNLTCVTLNHT